MGQVGLPVARLWESSPAGPAQGCQIISWQGQNSSAVIDFSESLRITGASSSLDGKEDTLVKSSKKMLSNNSATWGMSAEKSEQNLNK